jgi:hypothetical protein
MKRTTAILALLALGACTSGTAGDQMNVVNADETLTTENIIENDSIAKVDPIPTPQRITHNYNFHEDDLYGYIGAVSEEEHKRGKAAGDVVMFRYRGFWDGIDHLEGVDANGRILSYEECKRPCVAIKSRSYGRIERIAYNPSSIIGAAFQDAINGLLEPHPEPRAIAEIEDASQERQVDAASDVDESESSAPLE